jgi:hypothetical protein
MMKQDKIAKKRVSAALAIRNWNKAEYRDSWRVSISPPKADAP